jgi:hypothetical protein
MAHIIYRPGPEMGTMQLIINGVDYSRDVYDNIEIVHVGDDPLASDVGLRVTFALGEVEFGGNAPAETCRFESEMARYSAILEKAIDRLPEGIGRELNRSATAGKRNNKRGGPR